MEQEQEVRQDRLQKILATAGIASRRKAEQLIVGGRVTVNGKTITELGTKADPDHDHIKVDGKLIRQPAQFLYIALNKPDNVVSTASDPQRRTTVLDVLEGVKARVFPVGRLDYHSTGLLLLTNDGEFANAITAAKSHVTKTYLVKTKGQLTSEQEEEFRNGIPLSGKRTAPAGLRLIRRGDNPWYEVRLIEGRNQQIRIMFKHFGHLVEKLRRVKIGSVELGTLKPGEFRLLLPEEVKKLMRLASGQAKDSVYIPNRDEKRQGPKKAGAKKAGVQKAGAKKTGVKKAGPAKSGATAAPSKETGAKPGGR